MTSSEISWSSTQPKEVGALTWFEIQQQPALWPTTAVRVREVITRLNLRATLKDARAVITGAGTSAYGAAVVAAAWPRSRAVPSTDLLLAIEPYMEDATVLVSLARSGNSPESMAEEHWKKWTALYNQKMLSRGEFKDLYVYGYDSPEAYAIEKDGKMFYAFYSPKADKSWKGKIELRGLAAGKYHVHDYANDKDLGELDAAKPTIDTEFTGSLQLETVKE